MTVTLDGRHMVFPKPKRGEKFVHKTLGARKSGNSYKLPANSLNALRLLDTYGEEFFHGAPAELLDLLEGWGFEDWTLDELVHYENEFPEMKELYFFQKETVDYLVNNPHGAGLTVLTPGLGKTAVSIMAARILGYRRVLVLSPPTLGPSWISELSTWWPGGPAIKRAIRTDPAPGDEWTVTNHQTLRETVAKDEHGKILTFVEGYEDKRDIFNEGFYPENSQKLKKWIAEGPKVVNKKGKRVPARERVYRLNRDYAQDWDAVILDESILYKTRDRVRTELLETLTKLKPDADVWELSGFPTTKGRQDLYTQLRIMDRVAFSSYWRLVEFLCIVDKEGWGWTIEEDDPQVDPEHYLRDYMIVFSQEDVMPELPDYIPWRLPVEPLPAQRKALDEMVEEWKTELEAGEGPVQADVLLARTTRLAQITSNLGAVPKPSGKGFHKAGSAKEDLLIELIQNQQVETPMLVWAWYRETAKALFSRLNKDAKGLSTGLVIGGGEYNDQVIQAYKDGEIDILVMQQNIGKYGHTFTHTKTVFYHDRAYDLDAWVQSLRRVRRIGLEHRPVLVIPEIEDSFDQWVEEYLEDNLPSAAELTRSSLISLLARNKGE